MAAGGEELKEERLLTRLAETWWRKRSGNPGFGWQHARAALSSPKAKAALAELNWKLAASDNELYTAFIAGVAKAHYKAVDFDSWDQGKDTDLGSTMQIANQQRKYKPQESAKPQPLQLERREQSQSQRKQPTKMQQEDGQSSAQPLLRSERGSQPPEAAKLQR